MERGFWREQRGRGWGAYPGAFCRASEESSFDPPLIGLAVGNRVGISAVPFLTPCPRCFSPLFLPEDTELQVSQNLAQESEKCCWTHVPKLGQFPHPSPPPSASAPVALLHYVPHPLPVP